MMLRFSLELGSPEAGQSSPYTALEIHKDAQGTIVFNLIGFEGTIEARGTCEPEELMQLAEILCAEEEN